MNRIRRTRIDDDLIAIGEVCTASADKRATTGSIADRLGVGNGIASGMLKQLADDGLVDHLPYERRATDGSGVSPCAAIVVWLDGTRPALSLDQHGGDLRAIPFSPDGNQPATADGGGWLHVWSTDDGTLLKTHRFRNNVINDLVFTENESLLVGDSSGGMIIHADVARRGTNSYKRTHQHGWMRLASASPALMNGVLNHAERTLRAKRTKL